MQRTGIPLRELFFTCFKIGSLSFGGGVSGWTYREFVERKKWITDEDFAANLAIAQMLPGANVVNLVIAVGETLRGAAGAATCFVGFLIAPFFVVICLSSAMRKVAHISEVPTALEGIAFAAIGMVIVLVGRSASRLRHNLPALSIILLVMLGISVLHLPMLVVVLVLTPASVGLAWLRVRLNG